MKNILAVLLILPLMAGCSAPVVQNVISKPSLVSQSQNNLTVINVSDKAGASFGVKVNLDGFSTKANVDGKPAKQPSDVNKVDVYLLKLPSGFTGTDPLGTSSENVIKSFTNVSKSDTGFNILFKNVAGMSVDQYWVGIVAKDTNGNVISKGPSIAWTGQTATSVPAMSLSSSGIGVDSTTLEITSTNDLTVNISLLDAVGAQINSIANVSPGNPNIPTIEGQ